MSILDCDEIYFFLMMSSSKVVVVVLILIVMIFHHFYDGKVFSYSSHVVSERGIVEIVDDGVSDANIIKIYFFRFFEFGSDIFVQGWKTKNHKGFF